MVTDHHLLPVGILQLITNKVIILIKNNNIFIIPMLKSNAIRIVVLMCSVERRVMKMIMVVMVMTVLQRPLRILIQRHCLELSLGNDSSM